MFFVISRETFEPDIQDIYNFEKSVEQYTSVGGTAKSAVMEQIINFELKYFTN